MSASLADQVIECRVIQSLNHHSDHLPIGTHINTRVQMAEEGRKRQFLKTDTRAFQSVFTKQLPRTRYISTAAKLDGVVEDITRAMQAAIEASTPEVRICARSIPGFTDECKEAIQACKRAQRKWKAWGDEQSYQEYLDAKQVWASCISQAATTTHRDRVSQIRDEKGLWSLVKWAKNRGTPTAALTPDIRRSDGTMAEDTAGKAGALRDIFFPKPPDADLIISLTCREIYTLRLPRNYLIYQPDPTKILFCVYTNMS